MSAALGVLVVVAIGLHKIPEGIAASSLVLAAGGSRASALGAAVILGISTLLGVLSDAAHAAPGGQRTRALGGRDPLRRRVEPRAGIAARARVAAGARLRHWQCDLPRVAVAGGRMTPQPSMPPRAKNPGSALLPDSRSRRACGRARSTSSSGRSTCSRRESRCARRSSAAPWLDGLLGAAGHRQDDARARSIAQYTDREFVPFSAVTEGVPRVREIVARGGGRRRRRGAGRSSSSTRSTGSTRRSRTPSCRTSRTARSRSSARRPRTQLRDQRRAALADPGVRARSRSRRADIAAGARRALDDAERGLGAMQLTVGRRRARARSRREADGDARRALTVLEAAAAHVGAAGGPASPSRCRARRDAAALRALRQGGRGALTTCSAPTTSRSAAAIRRARCTGWRA